MHAILITTAALVGLPVLLHLILKQEPKRLLFPAIRFLVQKRLVSQRKMRLRHLLLLLMRMLLIALFGLALFQPTLFSTTLNLSGEQPVVAVFILDTSPSMGYTTNDRSRVAEAQRRALELIDELPSQSKVAVLDPLDPVARWEVNLNDARKKIEDWKEPRGATVPITTALASAYQLLKTVDEETEAQEPLPRLVAIFSDRTVHSWDASRVEDLKKLRENVPEPAVAHLYLDVGVDQPANVGITSVEVRPQQMIALGQMIEVNATLAATGPEVEATARIRFPGTAIPEQRKPVRIPGGGNVGVSFSVDSSALPVGLYQAEVSVETPDKLMIDNVRYLTVKITEPRKILTVSDNPSVDPQNPGPAWFWQLAHASKGEFVCDVGATSALPDLKPYEAVCLLNVEDPAKLWPKLASYVEAGGKLLIMPGASALLSSYSIEGSEDAARLLPGSLKAIIDSENLPPIAGKTPEQMQRGVTWLLDEAALRHPMLRPFREWKLRGNIDAVEVPRQVRKFWEVQPSADGTTVVWYDDSDDPKNRHRAILERSVGGKGGKVLLLTTRMDTPSAGVEEWNNYWESVNSSWYVVFPNLLMRYMIGDPSEVNYQFQTGQTVPVPLPRGDVELGGKLELQGPGVSLADSTIELGERQSELQLLANRTTNPGNFVLRSLDKKWIEGFSLNVPAEERSLERLSVESIEDLTGPGSVVPIEKQMSLRDAIATKFNQPIDLFPWLLILVLLLLALEGWVANRFYGR